MAYIYLDQGEDSTFFLKKYNMKMLYFNLR